jgi:hypothetical protein
MIINCSGKCGKKIIVPNIPDGKAYLCRQCWRALIHTILDLVRVAKEPHLTVVQPTLETESVA